MRIPLAATLLLTATASGCSTLNWGESAENWGEYHCRQERNAQCPEETPTSPLPSAPGDRNR